MILLIRNTINTTIFPISLLDTDYANPTRIFVTFRASQMDIKNILNLDIRSPLNTTIARKNA
jgi:hypothetical protein